MKLKTGVTMTGLKPQMRHALITADQVWENNGQELVVTSALDGEHSAGSWHYYGYALDLRTRYFDNKTKQKVFVELCHNIGEHYLVIMEPTHIHVQYTGDHNG